MLKFSLNISRTAASIRKFGSILPGRMRPAVRNTSKIFLERIIDKTPAPPTPLGQIYVRTGRLRQGWQDAGAELGISVPSFTAPPYAGYYGASPREIDLGGPGFGEVVRRDMLSFLMRNRVPYAFFVEVVGPTFKSTGGLVGPSIGGVFMVTKSSFETEPDFIREIQSAWASIP